MAVSPPVSSAPSPNPARHAGLPGLPGLPGLLAAAAIGLQALGCAGFAVVFLFVAPNSASLSPTSHAMFSLFTLLFAFGLGLVARGLWQGLSWPRTAAFVWFVMLLPLGWAMVQPGRGLVGGLILDSAVIGIGAVAQESRSAARA